MANNEIILRRPWRIKPKVVMMNKLKQVLARSLSSSGSVLTSPTSIFSTLSSYTSLASLTLKTAGGRWQYRLLGVDGHQLLQIAKLSPSSSFSWAELTLFSLYHSIATVTSSIATVTSSLAIVTSSIATVTFSRVGH